MPKTQSQYSADYNRRAYDQITAHLPRGTKSALQDHARIHDRSFNAFIIRAISQTLRDDGAAADLIAAVSGNVSDSSSG